MKKIVVALGGNALQSKDIENTAEGQLTVIKRTVRYLSDIYGEGYEISIVHGNGPQVGRIVLASEAAKNITPAMPFDVCGAMSQGYIGYHIQQAMGNALRARGIGKPVATVATQIVVDSNDKGFKSPTKPIGPFYSEEDAIALRDKGYCMKEDAGRGWRRVVASPIPKRIVEIEAIKELGKSAIVISCGGGGVPVTEKKDGSLEGVAAVIDKDFAAELLAENLDADILLILTEVEKAAINWQKPNQAFLGNITADEAEKYVVEGHFAPGSMLPKVEAAIKFARTKPERKAIITSLDNAVKALKGETGTCIYG